MVRTVQPAALAMSRVVSVLPPQNIKVRAFVPEPRIGGIRVGDRAEVLVDGVPEALDRKSTRLNSSHRT